VKVQNIDFLLDFVSQRGDYKDLSHLLCDVVQSGIPSLTFLRNVVPFCSVLMTDNSSSNNPSDYMTSLPGRRYLSESNSAMLRTY